MSDVNLLCGRNGCDVTFPRATVGRPRKFCSAACRKAASRAQIRAIQATPTYRIVRDSLTTSDNLAIIHTRDHARLVATVESAFVALDQRWKLFKVQSTAHTSGYRDARADMLAALNDIRSALTQLNVGLQVASDLPST